jgi:hypothetical protein
VGDTAYEPDETFTVMLSNAVHVKLADATATATIMSDDVAPPPAMPGHHTGAYTDGPYFNFDVGSAETTISNIAFAFNGHCHSPKEGWTMWASGGIPGPFPLGPRGSFSANAEYTYSNAVGTFAATWTVSANGSASGSLRVDVVFLDGVPCESTGTWSAHVG